MNCFPDGLDTCTVSRAEVSNAISTLSQVAAAAIFNPDESISHRTSESHCSDDGCDDEKDAADTGSFDGNQPTSISVSCLQLQQEIVNGVFPLGRKTLCKPAAILYNFVHTCILLLYDISLYLNNLRKISHHIQ